MFLSENRQRHCTHLHDDDIAKLYLYRSGFTWRQLRSWWLHDVMLRVSVKLVLYIGCVSRRGIAELSQGIVEVDDVA